jgi:hypothetical protein
MIERGLNALLTRVNLRRVYAFESLVALELQTHARRIRDRLRQVALAGSRRSRRWSPRKLKDITARKMKIPGISIHG